MQREEQVQKHLPQRGRQLHQETAGGGDRGYEETDPIFVFILAHEGVGRCSNQAPAQHAHHTHAGLGREGGDGGHVEHREAEKGRVRDHAGPHLYNHEALSSHQRAAGRKLLPDPRSVGEGEGRGEGGPVAAEEGAAD